MHQRAIGKRSTRRARRPLGAVLLAVLLLAGPWALGWGSAGAAAPYPAATVLGTVTNAVTGAPVAGAVVTVDVDVNGQTVETATNAQGAYSLPVWLPPSGSTVRVVVTATGYRPWTWHLTSAGSLQPGQSVTANAALTPSTFSFSGVVTDAVTHAPVSGATVQVWLDSTGATAAVTTNAFGAYALTLPLGAGSNYGYQLAVTARGYQGYYANTGATLTPGQTATVSVGLTPSAATLTGVVTGTGGAPVPGATVKVWASWTGASATATADSQGRYTVSLPVPVGGTGWRMTVRAPGYRPWFRDTGGNSLYGGQTVTVNPTLTAPTALVTGTVTNAQGAPVAGAAVTVWASWDGATAATTTNAAGHYQVPIAVPVGGSGLRLTIAAAGYLTWFQDGGYHLSAGRTTLVNAQLTAPTATLTGTVTANGTPVAGATVSAWAVQTGAVATAATNGQGQYTLALPVPVGGSPVRMTVTSPGAQALYVDVNGNGALSPGQTATVNAALATASSPAPLQTVTGSVVSTTGAPVAGATVFIHASVNNAGTAPLWATATTGATGQFTAAIPAGLGSYGTVVTAVAPGYRAQDYPASGGVPLGTGPVVLGPADGSVTGTVKVATTQSPLAGATVWWVTGPNSAGVSTLIAQAPSDSTGAFAMSGPWDELASSVVTTAAPGYSTNFFGATASEALPLSGPLTLAPALVPVAGTVTDAATHAPIPGARVWVTTQFSNGAVATILGSATTDSTGAYTIAIPATQAGGYTTVTTVAPGYDTAADATPSNYIDLGTALTLGPPDQVVTATVQSAATGAPVAGAAVATATDGNLTNGVSTLLGVGETDAAGHVRIPIPWIEDGGYNYALATAPGYSTTADGAAASAYLPPGTPLTLGPVTTTITGTVTDAVTGVAVPDATVQYVQVPSGGGPAAVWATAQTNRAGQYTLTGPAAAVFGSGTTMELSVDAPGWAVAAVPVAGPAGATTTVPVVLTPAVHVPSLTTVTPAAGPAGTVVNIAGSHFSTTDGVWFGSVPATAWRVVSPTLIQATVPPGTGTGTVPVIVQAAGGTTAPSPAALYMYAAEPGSGAPTATLSVTVVNGGGQPVTGALVTVTDPATGTVAGPLTTDSRGTVAVPGSYRAGEPLTVAATAPYPAGTGQTSTVLTAGANALTVTVGTVPLVTSDPTAVTSTGMADAVWPVVVPRPGAAIASQAGPYAQVLWTFTEGMGSPPVVLAGNAAGTAPFCVDGTWTLALAGPVTETLTGQGTVSGGQCIRTSGPATPLNLGSLGLPAGTYEAEMTWNTGAVGTAYGTTPVYALGPLQDVFLGQGFPDKVTLAGQATLSVGQTASVPVTIAVGPPVGGVHGLIGFDPSALAVTALTPPPGWTNTVRNNFLNGDGGFFFGGPGPVYAGQALLTVTLTCLAPGTFPLSFSGNYWGAGTTDGNDYSQSVSGTATVTCTPAAPGPTTALGAHRDPTTGRVHLTLTGTALGAAAGVALVPAAGGAAVPAATWTVTGGTTVTATWPARLPPGYYGLRVTDATGTLLAATGPTAYLIPPDLPFFGLARVDHLPQVPGIPTTHLWQVANAGPVDGTAVLVFTFPAYLPTMPTFTDPPPGSQVLLAGRTAQGWVVFVAVPVAAGGIADVAWTVTVPSSLVFGGAPTLPLGDGVTMNVGLVGQFTAPEWAAVAGAAPSTVIATALDTGINDATAALDAINAQPPTEALAYWDHLQPSALATGLVQVGLFRIVDQLNYQTARTIGLPLTPFADPPGGSFCPLPGGLAPPTVEPATSLNGQPTDAFLGDFVRDTADSFANGAAAGSLQGLLNGSFLSFLTTVDPNAYPGWTGTAPAPWAPAFGHQDAFAIGNRLGSYVGYGIGATGAAIWASQIPLSQANLYFASLFNTTASATEAGVSTAGLEADLSPTVVADQGGGFPYENGGVSDVMHVGMHPAPAPSYPGGFAVEQGTAPEAPPAVLFRFDGDVWLAQHGLATEQPLSPDAFAQAVSTSGSTARPLTIPVGPNTATYPNPGGYLGQGGSFGGAGAGGSWAPVPSAQPPACTAGSEDPNNLTLTPPGAGPAGWLVPQPVTYLVHVQNIGNAPAHTIRILVPISPALQATSLQVVGSSFPTPQVVYDARTRTATFTFTGVNLPPDTPPPTGEGWLAFRLTPQPGLVNGQAVTEQATVIFDANPPVATPAVTWTADTQPPGVTMQPLPPVSPPGTLTVRWTDRSAVAPILNTVYVAVDGGPLAPVGRTTGTQWTLAVQAGHTYGVAVQATDAAGLADPLPARPLVVTAISGAGAATHTTVSGPVRRVPGERGTWVAVVHGPPGAALAGTVQWRVNGVLVATVPLTAGDTAVWTGTVPVGTDVVAATYTGGSGVAPSSGTLAVVVRPPSFGAVVTLAQPAWGPLWTAAQAMALAIVRSGWTYWTLLHHALGALGASAASVQRLADHLFYQDHVTVSGPFAGVGPAGLWAWVHHPVGYYGTTAIPLQRAADRVWDAPVRYAVLLHHPVGALGPAAVAGQQAADVLWYRYDVGM